MARPRQEQEWKALVQDAVDARKSAEALYDALTRRNHNGRYTAPHQEHKPPLLQESPIPS